MSEKSKINSNEDVLSWELFLKGSNFRNKSLPSKPTLDNRLIFETKNLFIIAGLGSFVPGYFLIITKSPYTSFAQLNDQEFIEYKWIINKLFKFNKFKYNQSSAVFEHGMCACAGGLDHAHVHVMPIPSKSSDKEFKGILNRVLKKRAAGINKIEFKDNSFENVHDISTIINLNDEYKILDGKLLIAEDLINSDLNFEKFRDKLLLTQQYINFSTSDLKISFCTNHYLGTQFGRELVYEIFMHNEKERKIEYNNISRSDPGKLIWRWQDYMFEKNIIQTMKDFVDNYNKIFEKEKDHSFIIHLKN